jgi:uncharacterized repeat protein (TIGR03843 family)
MDDAQCLVALQEGEISLQGQFMYGSNYTFFVDIAYNGEKIKAVYKPMRGEQLLWDFPARSLARREVAAWLISEKLGWKFVPPTVLRRHKAPLGAGSVQWFIEYDPELHYFTFDNELRQRLRPVVLFDLVINNADRKGGHLLVDPVGKLWAIDHGLCFHAEEKLRTVIWDFAGEPIPGVLLNELKKFLDQLADEQEFTLRLAELLNPFEIKAMIARVREVLKSGKFPQAPEDRRAFPWPPV